MNSLIKNTPLNSLVKRSIPPLYKDLLIWTNRVYDPTTHQIKSRITPEYNLTLKQGCVTNIHDAGIEFVFNYPIPASAVITFDGTLDPANVVNANTKLTFTGTGTIYNLRIKDWTGRTLHYYYCVNGRIAFIPDACNDNYITVTGATINDLWSRQDNFFPSDENGFAIAGNFISNKRIAQESVQSMINHTDSGNVWYVRPSGGDYGDKDGTSYADAWDGFANIVWGVGGVVAGDTLYVCGTHAELLTVGLSGADGSYVIIRGDYPGDTGIIDSEDTRNIGINISSKNYVWLKSISSIDAVVSCINIEGTSEWVITEDSVFSGSGNQGIQHLDTAKAIHINVTANDCVDDGLSMHDDTRCIVVTGSFDGNKESVNNIETSEIFCYDITTTNSTTYSFYSIALNAEKTYSYFDGFVFDNDAKNIISGTGISIAIFKNGTSLSATVNNFIANGNLYMFNVECESASVADVYLYGAGYAKIFGCRTKGKSAVDNFLVKDTSSLDILNCVFYNLTASKAGVYQTSSGNVNVFNNTFIGSNAGATDGIGLRSDAGDTIITNNIFVNIKWVLFDSTGGRMVADNNCFYNNTKNQYYANATIANSVITDPLVNVTTGLISAGSSCIDAGKDMGFALGLHPEHSFGTSSGKYIVQELYGTYDIGAYIYTSTGYAVSDYVLLTGNETGVATYHGLIATKGQPEIGAQAYLKTLFDFAQTPNTVIEDAGISWDDWDGEDTNEDTVGTAETDLDTDYCNAITASLMTCTSIAGYAGTSNVSKRLFFKVADRVMKDDGSFLAESGRVQEILVYKRDLSSSEILRVQKYCREVTE